MATQTIATSGYTSAGSTLYLLTANDIANDAIDAAIVGSSDTRYVTTVVVGSSVVELVIGAETQLGTGRQDLSSAFESNGSVTVTYGLHSFKFIISEDATAVDNAETYTWGLNTQAAARAASFLTAVAAATSGEAGSIVLDDGAKDHAVDAGDAAWDFSPDEPTVTYVSSGIAANAGDAAWDFATTEPTVTVLGNKAVDAGDATWDFDIPAVSVTKNESLGASAGDASWDFAVTQPTVSRMGTRVTTEYAYRVATSLTQADLPTGNTDAIPAAWTATPGSATATEGVYRIARERTEVNDAFDSATDWEWSPELVLQPWRRPERPRSDKSRRYVATVRHKETGATATVSWNVQAEVQDGEDGEDGDPGVDGVAREYIFTSSATADAITGDANLPLATQNYDVDALRTTNGLVRGTQKYYDGTPKDLSAARPFQIRFRRKITGDPAQNSDIGTVAWTQDTAVRAVGQDGEDGDDGDPGVDGVAREYIFTSSATADAITGNANLPLATQNYDVDALRTTNGLVRGTQKYYDGTPKDLSESRPYQIRFRRKITGDPAQNSDIGSVAWTQDAAIRVIGQGGEDGEDGDDGDPGVDGVAREYVFTSSTTATAITGDANLPLATQNYDVDALRTTNGLVRGTQKYYDGTPKDLSESRPYQIRFRRKITGDPAQNADIGSVAWTQDTAIRVIGRDGEDGEDGEDGDGRDGRGVEYIFTASATDAEITGAGNLPLATQNYDVDALRTSNGLVRGTQRYYDGTPGDLGPDKPYQRRFNRGVSGAPAQNEDIGSVAWTQEAAVLRVFGGPPPLAQLWTVIPRTTPTAEGVTAAETWYANSYDDMTQTTMISVKAGGSYPSNCEIAFVLCTWNPFGNDSTGQPDSEYRYWCAYAVLGCEYDATADRLNLTVRLHGASHSTVGAITNQHVFVGMTVNPEAELGALGSIANKISYLGGATSKQYRSVGTNGVVSWIVNDGLGSFSGSTFRPVNPEPGTTQSVEIAMLVDGEIVDTDRFTVSYQLAWIFREFTSLAKAHNIRMTGSTTNYPPNWFTVAPARLYWEVRLISTELQLFFGAESTTGAIELTDAAKADIAVRLGDDSTTAYHYGGIGSDTVEPYRIPHEAGDDTKDFFDNFTSGDNATVLIFRGGEVPSGPPGARPGGGTVVDSAAPALSSASVDGSALTLAYNENLDGGSVPAATRFTVSVSGAPAAVDSVGISGSNVVLTLEYAVDPGATVTVTYRVGTNPIRDIAGNDASPFANTAVSNRTRSGPDVGAPALFDATVNVSTLELTYHETLDSQSVPANSRYQVTVSGTSRGIGSIGIVGRVVQIFLASAVSHGDTVQVSYTPGASPIRDPQGNEAAGLSNFNVRNETPTPYRVRILNPIDVLALNDTHDFNADMEQTSDGGQTYTMVTPDANSRLWSTVVGGGTFSIQGGTYTPSSAGGKTIRFQADKNGTTYQDTHFFSVAAADTDLTLVWNEDLHRFVFTDTSANRLEAGNTVWTYYLSGVQFRLSGQSVWADYSALFGGNAYAVVDDTLSIPFPTNDDPPSGSRWRFRLWNANSGWFSGLIYVDIP